MTAQHRDDVQLLLPVVDPAGVDAEHLSDARRQAVVGVAARPMQRQVRTRPTGERPGTHVVATPAYCHIDPQPAADGDRLLLTVPEAARLLHIGRRQAWELVWRGELPVVRLGRSVSVARPVLERFVAERSAPYVA